jgi:lipopolysaccharide biosynthesis glycosyltransferase
VRTAALFADRWILPGLHATLASLLEYSRHSPPFRIVVFGDGLRPHEVELLRATTAPLLGAHTLEVRAFTISLRGRFRSLRGNYTTYYRLFLPELLADSDRCVYLDCDLVITCAIDPLFDLADAGHALAAEGTGVRKDSLDHALFADLAMDPNGAYFNCGVLVFDLERWRREQLTQECLQFADTHPDRLLSADQTVLNVVMAERCHHFDSRFNSFLWPSTRAIPPDAWVGRVFHFVGAPKPWNYLGRFASGNYALWRHWVNRSSWARDGRSAVESRLGFRQEARISRATMRALLKRLRGQTEHASFVQP